MNEGNSKMTEKEVILYLKQNKTKGTAFAFMPEDVRNWCEKHKNESIFNVYYSEGWNIIRSEINCSYSGIYALPDNYEPKGEFVPHWEEFEVTNGTFHYVSSANECYQWFEWQRFLLDYGYRFNAFGGWSYERATKSQLWSTFPRFLDKYGDLHMFGTEDEVKPVIPNRIRFWRYQK